ncbi:MAG: NUDIX hydrolase [Rhodocyclales bacterium]|nr:NUDIX hydrolase [Rhodocyclales bacterium]
MIWKPHVTVAAVVERDGKYLLVEEEIDGGLAFNQPAGHLEEGESLLAAVVRETLEETAYHLKPTQLVGIYHWQHPTKGITYLRFAFTGELRGYEAGRQLDEGIVGARWLTYEEVLATQDRHRSPLILRCIDDLRAGKRFPLELLVHY